MEVLQTSALPLGDGAFSLSNLAIQNGANKTGLSSQRRRTDKIPTVLKSVRDATVKNHRRSLIAHDRKRDPVR